MSKYFLTRRHKFQTWLKWPKKRVTSRRNKVEKLNEQWKEKNEEKYKPDF